MNIAGKIVADPNASLGTRIRRAREERGWTLERLGSEIGVSKVSIWTWERERSMPRPETRRRLCAVLGISAVESGHVAAQLVSEIIAEYQTRIASVIGVDADAVEIKITFSRSG